MFRFIHQCRKISRPVLLALSAEECQHARLFWIRIIQSETLDKELKSLRGKRELSSKSSLLILRPFLDEKNILRVGGRLANAPIPFSKKHPVLLADHPVTRLIIRHAHVQSLHAGIQLTLATLRQEYWIL